MACSIGIWAITALLTQDLRPPDVALDAAPFPGDDDSGVTAHDEEAGGPSTGPFPAAAPPAPAPLYSLHEALERVAQAIPPADTERGIAVAVVEPKRPFLRDLGKTLRHTIREELTTRAATTVAELSYDALHGERGSRAVALLAQELGTGATVVVYVVAAAPGMTSPSVEMRVIDKEGRMIAREIASHIAIPAEVAALERKRLALEEFTAVAWRYDPNLIPVVRISYFMGNMAARRGVEIEPVIKDAAGRTVERAEFMGTSPTAEMKALYHLGIGAKVAGLGIVASVIGVIGLCGLAGLAGVAVLAAAFLPGLMAGVLPVIGLGILGGAAGVAFGTVVVASLPLGILGASINGMERQLHRAALVAHNKPIAQRLGLTEKDIAAKYLPNPNPISVLFEP